MNAHRLETNKNNDTYIMKQGVPAPPKQQTKCQRRRQTRQYAERRERLTPVMSASVSMLAQKVVQHERQPSNEQYVSASLEKQQTDAS